MLYHYIIEINIGESNCFIYVEDLDRFCLLLLVHLRPSMYLQVGYLVQLKNHQKLNVNDYKVISKALINPNTQHMVMPCVIESFLADCGFDYESFKDLLSNQKEAEN